MRRVWQGAAVAVLCLGLASTCWAQKGKGNAGGKGKAAGTAPTQTMPDRANKGGDVRGEPRAAEVQQMNQTKQATHKKAVHKKKTTTTIRSTATTTTTSTHGKAKGKAKAAKAKTQ